MSARVLEVRNATRRAPYGDRIRLAADRWSRLRGLLGRPEPQEGEGLMIYPCRGVHMYGMRYAIDVILLDEGRRVEALYPELAPWTRSKVHERARWALEVPVGTIERTETRAGDQLEWRDVT